MPLQCEEFLSKGEVDNLWALLAKAGNLLAPNSFKLAMYGSPIQRDPSAVVPRSEGSQTAEGNTGMEGNIGSRITVGETIASEVFEELEPEVISILIDKGKKLEQHRAIRQHAKKYLSDLGSVDVVKRCGCRSPLRVELHIPILVPVGGYQTI